ncbi:ribonuclease P protein component [Nocardioides caeni]|uniref:Ribonuclease P protein component n=1 Tax=Nocardioides caeni TaxID=574700 RepID=A0A4S8N2I1_9ACTN|nr:ribonuclease P protein component [Nocardioides caeni]THV10130.1 ribonuclease P protein component [Nocardioides caeni]
MLASAHRLTDPDTYRAASRRGRRAGARTVVAHLLPPSEEQVVGMPIRAGFVVSKAVGVAVVRNRVKRRLRHAVRERLDQLPAGSVLVVRAQPKAAVASYDELVADLDHCLRRVLSPTREAR